MEIFIVLLKILVAVSILNVWLVRREKVSRWRGGDALNLKDEFQRYGLPDWSMYLVGSFKVIFALALLASIWFQELTLPSAVGIATLMLGAVAAHVKIKDPWIKSLPSASFLILSMVILIYNSGL